MVRYVRWCELRGLAAGTVAVKRRELTGWLAWTTAAGRAWPDATRGDVERWLGGRQLGVRARYSAVSHLHGFYRWARREGLAVGDPTELVERPRLPRRLPRPAREPVVERVVAGLAVGPWRAALALAAWGGLRCCELASVTWGDVDLVAGVVWVREGKGGHDRVVPVSARLRRELAPLDGSTGPVLVSPQTGQPYTPARVSQLGCQLLRRAGAGVTMHQLRHHYATGLCERGVPLEVVQDVLGHASPTTTRVYAAVSPGRLRAAAAWS